MKTRIVTIPIDEILLDSLSLDAIQTGLINDNESITKITSRVDDGLVVEVEEVF